MPLMLGRKDRIYNPTIPHMSALRMTNKYAPPPSSVDWTQGKNIPWGMMKNDELGDCTCAGAYHAMQLFSAHGRDTVLTENDQYVVSMYEEFCGYRPGNASTDQGGIEQDILTRWHSTGVPIQEGSRNNRPGRSKLKGFIEVDPRNHNDVKQAINDCGLVYIGFRVPSWLVSSSAVPNVWNVQGSGDNIVGGHCVIQPGFNDTGLRTVSWGAEYTMGWDFFDKYVDEVYALLHPWWIDSTGRTPLGLDVNQVSDLMNSIKGDARIHF